MVLALFTLTANAQRSDDFFRESEFDNYNNRTAIAATGWITIDGMDFEDPTAPLGSGLLIMTVAGAGYVAMKRRRTIKKSALLLIACAMLLGFTQCKKKTVEVVTNDGVPFTLIATYDAGDRTVFVPGTASFTWNNGQTEYIYVSTASKGYIGELTGIGDGSGTNNTMEFNGTLQQTISSGETLYFFYLGNNHQTGAEFNINYHQASLTIADQSEGTTNTVTNYHFASGSGSAVSNGDGSYSASANLTTKIAIAYFDLSEFNVNNEPENVYLYGDDIYGRVTLNFDNGEFTGNTQGYINLGKANTTGGGKYVALVPSTESETVLRFLSNTKQGSITFLRGIKPHKFYAANNTEALPITTASVTAPTGAINHLFTVASNNGVATKLVRFSKGNLQYKAEGSSVDPTTGNIIGGTWRFAENQWNYVGDATNGNVYVGGTKSSNTGINISYSGWIDLFSWGTSGYKHRDYSYQPYRNDENTLYYNKQSSAYNSLTKNLSDSKNDGSMRGMADWGYNEIHCGENIIPENSGWRTPTSGEWSYLMLRKIVVAGNNEKAFGHSIVNGVNGLVLLPDDWDGTVKPDFNYDNPSAAFTNNTISADDWLIMETAGAVFLPVTGYRGRSSGGGAYVSYTTEKGYYWTNNYHDDSNADEIIIDQSSFYVNYQGRTYGHAVRLVKDLE